jgi:hypothetical protein
VVSKRTRWGVAAFAAISLVTVSTPASAVVMMATFTGTVASGLDQTNFFGLGTNGDLGGEAFTAIFRYDTTISQRQVTSTYDRLTGGPFFGGGFLSPITYASLEINNVTDVMPVFGSGAANVERGTNTWEQTFAYTDSFEASATGQVWAFLQLYVLSAPTPVLVTTPYVGGNLPLPGRPSETPMVNRFVFNNQTGYSLNYNAIFSPVQVVLQPVPEPATWAMLIIGFLGTGVALRRRRRELAQ